MISICNNNIFGGALRSSGLVQQKEIDWYVRNYSTLAIQASVLTGFSSQKLGSFNSSLQPYYLIGTLQIVLQTLALMSELYVLVVSTFACIWAPALALRGVHGLKSGRQTLRILDKLLSGIIATWLFGLFSFIVSSLISTIAISKTEKSVNQSILITTFTILIIVGISFNSVRLFYCNVNRRSTIEVLTDAEAIGDLDNLD